MATSTDANKAASCGPQVGSVTWIEIPAVDLSRVKIFYSTVFDWTFPSMAPPGVECKGDPDYLMFTKGTTNGGFQKVSPENFLSPALHPDNPEQKRISVRVTLNVESVDDTLEAVVKAGGAVYTPKREIPNNMGYVGYFTDTERNVMGCWSAK